MALVLPRLVLLPLIGLAGCIPYPVYKTVQPSSQITVTNERNEPIEGANVVLITYSNPHAVERHRQIKLTDQNGIAVFEHRSEWRRENMLMMHGVEFFFWNSCVQKSGFKTYLSRSGGDFDPLPTVQLSPGPSSECPAPPSTQSTGKEPK